MRTGPLFTAAAASYAANAALGTSVLVKVLDTSGYRWLHHALYIATLTLSVTAASGAVWATPRRTARQSALLLLPAAVPMTLIPYVGSRGPRHIVVALAALPFYAASLVRAWR